ncbi:glycosyl hydrolase family 26 [Streptomyces armeniacus]|uniref:Glycosyl hydrolase family 26 n=1 Tax=Streptomyces armeniacus TaxID=83291 RepID=A0A345XSK2_9ACTN|nr:glycosyl hydrolase [Streptomyces armeniacus]AXK34618.1 glycosyl hydrolase family 26 [Streptomyces armeniacus]
MSHRPLAVTGVCIGAVTAGLLATTALTEPENGGRGDSVPNSGKARSELRDQRRDQAQPGPAGGPAGEGAREIPFGAFLGSGPEGVWRMAGLKRWLGGREPRVGHTYLPGDLWSNIEGRPDFLYPWAKWRDARKNRLFVLNVPMLERNEADVPDAEVDRLLTAGADGRFDGHFRTLARRLVGLGLEDAVLVLGWEMNGTTYTHRCKPNPGAWKAYWQRIVTTMREVPGQRFRFDFAPARGEDAIGWTKCYPGDRYVDIVGMDSYDQPPGEEFKEHVRQPYGLQHQIDFAARHGKPVSYPEWGLFRGGDNPAYVRGMLNWIRQHRPVYHTITDYCPHGVWRCGKNPDSARVFRRTMSAPQPEPTPSRKPAQSATPSTTPSVTPSATGSRKPSASTEPSTRPSAKPSTVPSTRPSTDPSAKPSWPPSWKPAPSSGRDFCLNLGDWLQRLLGGGRFCFRHGPYVPQHGGTSASR